MLDVCSVAVYERLEPISFHVANGDGMLITGPNGAGKSTLMDCLSRVMKPTAGSITIGTDAPPAYLPQNPPRPFAYTVREYLEIGNKGDALPVCIERLGITPLLNKEITSLSAGQWQRVAISKVIATNRTVTILDEPDAPLDDQWSATLANIIETEIMEGKVFVVTLHRPEIKKIWKFQSLNLKPVHVS